MMNYKTLSELYYSVNKYFEEETLDDFVTLLGVLVAKNHSTFSAYEKVPKGGQRALDKRMYDTLKPFWKVIKKNPSQWDSYSYDVLITSLQIQVVSKLKDDAKIQIVSIFTLYKLVEVKGEKRVAITRPQSDKRSLRDDFMFSEEQQISVKEEIIKVKPVRLHKRWESWDTVCRRSGDFYWAWQLNNEQYLSLHEFLKTVLKDKTREEILRYSDYLSLYCAEWYKREYEGRGQGSGAVFRSVGVTGVQNLPQGIYDRIERINLRGGNRYLYSLYIQGGLPWKYILSNNYTNLARNIAKLFKLSSGVEVDVNEIAQDFDNTAIRESILDRGSIYENLKCIIEDEAYVQYIQSQFPGYESRIYKFVHAIRKEVKRNFSLAWRLDRRDNNGKQRNYLVPMLCFTSATENGILPSSLLDDCGVDLSKCTRFNLVVKSYNVEGDEIGIKEWTYHRCANPSYFSSSENFDGRVIGRYVSPDQIPSVFKIFIEDVPGPFGIRMDNGFDNASSEPIHIFDDHDLIKLYGETEDSLIYSNPKDTQLYILKRDFIGYKNEEQIVSCGSFGLIPVDEPIIVCVRGKEVKLTPYGLMEITLSSKTLVGVVDKSCVSVVEDRYYANVKHNGMSYDDTLLLSHHDLEGILVSIGGEQLNPDAYNVSYIDGKGQIIDNIEAYYGLAIIKVSCEKNAEQRIYIIDAERDLEREIIYLNGCEYDCRYDFQPENSMEFLLGNEAVGECRCSIYYPFEREDKILTYPIRKVYRSPRFYERSKDFYFTRVFDKEGCTESHYIADIYHEDRHKIRRCGDGTFLLEKPISEQLPDPKEFFFYNTVTGGLLQANEYVKRDGRYYLLISSGDFRRYDDQDLCIAFQSLKNSHSDVFYRYLSPALPNFNDSLWGIIHEHHLQVEDFWANNQDVTFELLVSYLSYTNDSPDYDYLMKIAKAKKFLWLMLGCNKIREVISNKDILWRILRETSPCKGSQNFEKFVELYVSKIKRINYHYNLTSKTRISTYAALVLSGELNVWSLSEEKRIEIYNYLLQDNSYKILISKLNLEK